MVLQKIIAALKKLGHIGIIKIWYAQASNSINGLVKVKNDVEPIALTRITLWKNYKNVDIYVC